MALNDISLTAGMRSNLVSLQGTVDLLSRTQSRLATGKKVNTALDNPTAFFAAQSLDSRAADIDSLKSAMGQAIQTIQAADKGIKGITSLIEQARGIAQQAYSASNTGSNLTQNLTISSLKAGEAVTIDGVAFTEGVTTGFAAANTDAQNTAALFTAINASASTVKANSINGNTISLGKPGVDLAAADVVVAGGTTGIAESGFIAGSNELTNLKTTYDSIRTQIDQMVSDSGYKGVNLLTSGSSLVVKFEGTNSLTVNGFGATTATLGGLNITSTATAATNWTSSATIDNSVNQLSSALSTLRAGSSAMSSNLSIITTRQDFSTNMVNVLTEGSGKLTLADTNEEGANMLMLQTRQSLSTTALSMASQAAQSVLRLFG